MLLSDWLADPVAPLFDWPSDFSPFCEGGGSSGVKAVEFHADGLSSTLAPSSLAPLFPLSTSITFLLNLPLLKVNCVLPAEVLKCFFYFFSLLIPLLLFLLLLLLSSHLYFSVLFFFCLLIYILLLLLSPSSYSPSSIDTL